MQLKRLVIWLRSSVSRRWEEIFFLVLIVLLRLQAYTFVADAQSAFPALTGATASFFSFELFVVEGAPFVAIPLIVLTLLGLVMRRAQLFPWRRYLDLVGLYVAIRMFVQFIGLNLLVFDQVTPGFVLLTQLLFFLPYSMLVWGWIYWRLDRVASARGRSFFRLDCEREEPRPVDYLVAALSCIFSASISVIKGRSARSKLLILVHGFFVYDIMGLTLSRAVALVQTRST